MLNQRNVAESDDPLLTAREVMRRLRVSRRTLDRWAANGKLPVLRIQGFADRRFRKSDVDSLLSPRALAAAEEAER